MMIHFWNVWHNMRFNTDYLQFICEVSQDCLMEVNQEYNRRKCRAFWIKLKRKRHDSWSGGILHYELNIVDSIHSLLEILHIVWKRSKLPPWQSRSLLSKMETYCTYITLFEVKKNIWNMCNVSCRLLLEIQYIYTLLVNKYSLYHIELQTIKKNWDNSIKLLFKCIRIFS